MHRYAVWMDSYYRCSYIDLWTIMVQKYKTAHARPSAHRHSMQCLAMPYEMEKLFAPKWEFTTTFSFAFYNSCKILWNENGSNFHRIFSLSAGNELLAHIVFCHPSLRVVFCHHIFSFAIFIVRSTLFSSNIFWMNQILEWILMILSLTLQTAAQWYLQCATFVSTKTCTPSAETVSNKKLKLDFYRQNWAKLPIVYLTHFHYLVSPIWSSYSSSFLRHK